MQASLKNRLDPMNVVAASTALIALIVISAALSYAKGILVPFVLALFISFSVLPLVNYLQAKSRVPHIAAVFLTLAIVLTMVILICILASGNVRTFLSNSDGYKAQLLIVVEQGIEYLQAKGIAIQKADVLKSIQDTPLFPMLRETASKVLTLGMNALLVAIFVMFMLTGKERALPASGIWEKIGTNIRVYLWTKFVSSFVTGVLTAIVLAILGLPMSIMFGVIAFILNYIPTVGSIVAVLLPAPIAFIYFRNPVTASLCVLVPSSIHLIIGNIIEPKYVGDALDLHPVTILLSLMFWGLLWGVPGMVLATPLCVIFKLFLEQFNQTQPLAKLMSGRIREALEFI